jgi:flagellar biosynthesis protein FlhA
VVITKGATRVAEVAARFTLDAMPGKQMSIDADLNAGLINDAEARQRRTEIEREANFYGAMDGASKFVRGDAVAGIIITLVNIIGGLTVGVLQHGLPVGEAARNYTLLTVGDGLVTQIPALIVSTAAGILVTRTTAATNMGDEVKRQLFYQPRAIGTAAVLILAFALIPGMPKFSFFLVAGLCGFIAYRIYAAAQAEEARPEEAVAAVTEEPPIVVTPVDLIGLEVGYALIPLVDSTQGGELLSRIKALRKQLAQEMGFVLPAIHIRDNLKLKPTEYSITIKGVEVAKGEVHPDHFLAIAPGDEVKKLRGIETVEPAFKMPAVWITAAEKEYAQALGFIVVNEATVITTHMTEVFKNNADELIGRREVQSLLEGLAYSHPKMVEELVPKVVPMGSLIKVLQRLLRERISIRDLGGIIETMADYINVTKNVDVLTGYVRQGLARSITKQHQDPTGTLNVIILSPRIEEEIYGKVQHTEYESFVSPDPQFVSRLLANLEKHLVEFTMIQQQPIILCSPNVRIFIRKILEKYFPALVILGHNEISREVKIRSLGMVEI